MEFEYEELEYEIMEGDLDPMYNHAAFIGTSNGVWVLSDERLMRVTERRAVYGITRDNLDQWIVTQRDGSHLHVLSVIEDGGACGYLKDLRDIDCYYSKGIHQIDMINDELYVCDTYNERLMVLSVIDQELKIHRVVYPTGRHTISHNRRQDFPNYHHFNSVYRNGNLVYLLAHNETIKTKRLSDIYVLECNTLRTVSILKGVGRCAHNMVVDFTGKMYICNSLDHSLVSYDGVGILDVWKDEKYKTFTRGLAINDDFTIMGGSVRTDSQLKGETNDDTDGYIFILDKKKQKVLCTLKLKGSGQIFEIRLHGLDYGLSETWRNKNDK